MSISSVGGTSPQAAPYHSQPAANGLKKPEEGSGKEVTTVTTKCDKEHEHNQSCPHTVSTRPAPGEGELGNHVDERV